jgi:hypothetical protein
MHRVLYRIQSVTIALVVILLTLGLGSALAKTPDGETPAEEQVCSGLSGAAFGLCNAYCEAQDCDVHPRPSCDRLRLNFQRLTGSATFPCEVRCGNGVVEPGEECDPPGDPCSRTEICNDDCACEPLPFCGDGEVNQPGEDCDPPDDPCSDAETCSENCECIEQLHCCLPTSPVPICDEQILPDECLSIGGTVEPGACPSSGFCE